MRQILAALPLAGGTLTGDLVVGNSSDLTVAGTATVNGATTLNQTTISRAGSGQLTVQSTGANTTQILLNTATAAQQAQLNFYDAGTLKWQLTKGTTNNLYVWNQSAANANIVFGAGATLATTINGSLTIPDGTLGLDSGDDTSDVFGVSVPPRIAYIYDGTDAAPVNLGNTLHVSRIQSVTRDDLLNELGSSTTDGAGFLAAIAGYAEGTTTDETQPVGVLGQAIQNSTVTGEVGTGNDAQGGYFVGLTRAGSTGRSCGIFAMGRNASSEGNAGTVGAEIHVMELGQAHAYNPTGAARGVGIWMTTLSDFDTPAGILIGNGSNAGRFEYALAIPAITGSTGPGAIKTAIIRDDGSSTTVFDINGTHTDGLDMVGATFSGKAIRLPNARAIAWRDSTNSVDVDVLYRNSSNITVLASPASIEGATAPQLAVTGSSSAAAISVNPTAGQIGGLRFYDGGTLKFSWEKGATNNFYLWNQAAGGAPIVVNAGATHTIGFLGAAAVARPTAYTQTYSTADRTHAAPTAATLTVTDGAGTNDNTIGAITADASVIAAVQEIADEINKLVADMADTKQLVNSVIDDFQAFGLLQ